MNIVNGSLLFSSKSKRSWIFRTTPSMNQEYLDSWRKRMLDIFIETKQLSYKELNVMFMESQNWFKKGFLFLKRKFVKTEPI